MTITDFIIAALPWIVMGVFLAIVSVHLSRKKVGEDAENENCICEGIALGMCFGVAIGTALKHISLGISMGMLIGLLIGRSIKKEKNQK